MLKLLRTGVLGRNRPLPPNSRQTAPPGVEPRSTWRTSVLAAALGLLSAGTAVAQIVIPVANTNGTGANRFPLGEFYGYERSAMIYRQSELGAAVAIANVGFFANSANSGSASLPVRVLMKHTAAAGFAAATTVATETAGTTVVFNGTVNMSSTVANTWVTIPLSSCFAYNGTDNLEIIIETNFGGGGGSGGSTGAAFRRSSPGAPNSFQSWNADTSPPTGTGATSVNRPNIRLNACPAPTGLAATPLATSANISYTAASVCGVFVTGYEYQVRDVTGGGVFGAWLPTGGANPFSVAGLTTNGNAYEVRMRSDCSGTMGDPSAAVAFSTTCSPFAGAQSVNFEGTTGATISSSTLPTCWSRTQVGTGAAAGTTSGGTPQSPGSLRQGALVAATVANATNRSMLISQPLLDLGSVGWQVRFRAKSSVVSGSSLAIGTVPAPGSSSFTVVPGQSAIPLNQNYQDFTVNMSGVVSGDPYIAFRHQQDVLGTGSTIYIDNIVWESVPTCPTPTALQVQQPTAQSVVATFNSAGGNSVELVWGAPGFDPNLAPPADRVTVGSGASPYIITGLAPATPYQVYARSSCGAGVFSAFIGPSTNFTTLPAPAAYEVTRATAVTYTSIQGTGTPFTWLPEGTFGNEDEGVSTAVSLNAIAPGFTFNMFGAVTAFQVTTNGILTFDTKATNTSSFTNSLAPGTWTRVVAPFWEDMVVQDEDIANLNKIRYQVTGVAPNRVITIEWANMERYFFTDPDLNFQVKLYETSNNVQIVYGGMTGFKGNEVGSQYSYSVGINGTTATQIVSQQLENTRFFANSAKNDLSIMPECNSSITFAPGTYTPYAPVAVAAPQNDQCANATGLSVNSVISETYCQLYTTVAATASAAPACAGVNTDDDVWFTFVNTSGAPVNINVRVGGSSSFDAGMQIFKGASCGALTELNDAEVVGAGTTGCVNATGASLAEAATINQAPNGQRYYVRVYHVGAGTGGNGTFVIDVYGLPNPPANDDCTVFAGPSAATYTLALAPTAGACTPQNFTSGGATNSGVTGGELLSDDDDVWFRFTAVTGGAQVFVQGVTGYDAEVEVMSGTCGGPYTSLAYADNTGDGGQEILSVGGLTIGNVYFIRVAHYGNLWGAGNFSICLRQLTPPANDVPSQATVAPYVLTPSLTCVNTAGTTVNATGPSDGTGIPAINSTNADDDVWYSFIAGSTSADVSLTPSATFQGAFIVYSGTPGALVFENGALANFPGVNLNQTISGLTIGDRYYVQVYDTRAGIEGTFSLCVQEFPVPGNDEPTAVGNATPYSLSVTPNCILTSGYTQAATASVGPNIPTEPSGTADDDVWYSFLAPTGGAPTITVTPTGFIDLVVVLYSGDPLTGLTEVTYVDDTVSPNAETIQASGLVAGQRYYVRVYDYFSDPEDRGQFTICVTNGPKKIKEFNAVYKIRGFQPTTASVGAGTTSNPILQIELPVVGATGTLPLQQVVVTSQNTNNADVSLVRLYRSTSATFSLGTAVQISTANFVGSTATLSGGNYDLPLGTTYLYVTYDIALSATPGNVVDGQVLANGVTINGVTFNDNALAPLNPAGTRTITPPPPANDEVCGAVTVPIGIGTVPVAVSVDNRTATNSSIIPGSCQTTSGKDLWYKMTVPATGTITVDVRGAGVSPNTDQVIELFTTSNGGCSGTFTRVGCDDDSGIGFQSAAVFAGLTPGATTYLRLAVYGTSPAGGTMELRVGDRPMFTGLVSNVWTNIENFSPRIDPISSLLSNNTIFIPAGIANTPVITASTSVRGINIRPGGKLGLTGTATLTIGNGSFTNNNGTFNQKGGATVRIDGTSTVSLGTAFPVLSFTNLSISSTGVSLGGAVRVRGVLTLDGSLTTNGREFTLMSKADTTALVVHNAGGAVVGNATVQRFVNGSISVDPIVYHHLSSPIQSAQVSTLSVSPFFFTVVNPNYNTTRTSSPFPNVFAYDEAAITGSFPLFTDGYVSPSSQADVMTPGKGFAVRMPDNITPDFVGNLNNGDVLVDNLTRSANAVDVGWHLLGNPYAAPIDWDLIVPAQRPGMDASIYVARSISLASGSEIYVTRNGSGVGNLGSTVGVNDGVLPLGQAFFIRTTGVQNQASTPGSVTFQNADRLTSFNVTNVYRPSAETRTILKLSVGRVGRPVAETDEAFVYFDATATAGRDHEHDATKMMSTGELPSIFSRMNGENYAINGLNELTAAELIVPMGVRVGVSGSYKLNLAEALNLPANTVVVLRDAVTGTEQDLRSNPSYAFTMDASYRGNRFTLVFNPSNGVTGVSAALAAGQVNVFPNPVASNSSLQVRMSALNTNVKSVSARLIDALGRVVATEQLTVINGEVDGAMSTRSLSKGVYTLQLTAGAQSATRRVVID